MKKGKIILGAAALIVTTASAFGLKAATHKLNHKQLHGTHGSGTSCLIVKCWTDAASGLKGACKTNSGNLTESTLYTTASCISHVWSSPWTVTTF
jgi:hypothetical protein